MVWVRCIVFVVILGSVLGCGEVAPAPGKQAASPLLAPYGYLAPTSRTPHGKLMISDRQFPLTPNPLFAASEADLALDAALWGQPVVYDQNFHVQPDQLIEVPLPENGGVQDSGRTVVMNLRHDLRWSDGVPIVASDFQYWWELNQDSSTGATVTFGYDQIERIETPDRFTVILRMKQPFGPYLFYLPLAAPQHAWGGRRPIDLQNIPSIVQTPEVTSGPYKVAKLEPGQSYSLVPNLNYVSTTFHGPFLSEVIYTKEQKSAGQVDVVQSYQGGAISENMRLFSVPAAAYAHLDFNAGKPWLRDRRVRAAIELALDVCGILKQELHAPDCSRRVGQVEPRPSLFYDPAIVPRAYDPEQARNLLEQAGWRQISGGLVKDGQPMTLRLATTEGDPARKAVAEAIQRELHAIGITVQLAYYARDSFFGGFTTGGVLATGAYDLALFTYANGPEPDDEYDVFHSSQIPDAAHPDLGNYGRVNDPVIDPALVQGRTTVDFATRMAAYHRFLQRMAEQVYVVPLYVELNVLVVRQGIQNVIPNPNRALNTWNIADWWD